MINPHESWWPGQDRTRDPWNTIDSDKDWPLNTIFVKTVDLYLYVSLI